MAASAPARLALSSEEARELARSTPAGFAFVASGGKWIPAKHLQMISERLVAIARREIDRLMIFQPPRSGKSQLVSEYTPPWYLGRFPDRRIILASYGAALASTWGRKSRDLLTEWGPEWFDVAVDAGSSAADRWDIAGRPGGMITAGIGGPITGRGADLLIIDDPIKDAEEAASDVIRAKHVDWYRSVARTRLMPKGAVVLMQTRWHEADLAGQLLAEMEGGGEQWEVLSLPAIAEEDDALGREAGEALWPHMFPLEVLEQTKRAVGGYFWSALYQQRPSPPEGFLFKRKDFRYWRLEVEHPERPIPQRWYVLPDGDEARRIDTGSVTTFQTVDVAISERETADYTVVATWQASPQGDLLLIDLERRHFEQQQIVEFLCACSDKYGRPPMWIERFGAGRNPLAIMAQRGYPVIEIPAEAGAQSDKITRAFGAVALTERHKLFLPSGQPGWLGEYEDELASFDKGVHDDQVDVTAYAARLLPTVMGGTQRHQVRHPGAQADGVMGAQW